jgi:hypothetical protein
MMMSAWAHEHHVSMGVAGRLASRAVWRRGRLASPPSGVAARLDAWPRVSIMGALAHKHHVSMDA